MAAYRHFSDKADLLRAICEAGFAQFADALEEARRQASPDFASRLTSMALAYVRFAAEHRAYFEVMFGPDERVAPAGESGKRAFGIPEETIRQGQESGDVRSGDSVVLARLVWAMVHGVSMLRLAPDLSGNGAGAQFTTFCSKVLLSGLSADPQPHSTLDSATQPTK